MTEKNDKVTPGARYKEGLDLPSSAGKHLIPSTVMQRLGRSMRVAILIPKANPPRG